MTEANSGVPAGLPGGAGAGHWVLDPQKSSVGFSHKHFWGLMTVRGSFSELAGEGDVGTDGAISGTLKVGAASVNTKNSQRDRHLRSADFFSADAHPHITFTAREARIDPAGNLAVSGELEAAGVARPLVVAAQVSEASPDSATLTANVDVDQVAHGMTWNRMGVIKGPATISVNARFTRQPS
jgi:polyisoprenoid-binding protein YceI